MVKERAVPAAWQISDAKHATEFSVAHFRRQLFLMMAKGAPNFFQGSTSKCAEAEAAARKLRAKGRQRAVNFFTAACKSGPGGWLLQ